MYEAERSYMTGRLGVSVMPQNTEFAEVIFVFINREKMVEQNTKEM